jgi:hypothetical protein
LCESGLIDNKSVASDFGKFIAHYINICSLYHNKLSPFYRIETSLTMIYPDNVFIVDRVFEELGRLGLVGTTLGFMAKAHGDQLAQERANEYSIYIEQLLQTHSVSGSPCFDCHAVDISLAMLALVVGEKANIAVEWLHTLIDRLGFAKRLGKYAPINTDSFDDLVAIREGDIGDLNEFSKDSTIVPTLALWCLLLNSQNSYDLLLSSVVPQYTGTTFNMWCPDKKYESVLVDKLSLHASGYGEGFHVLPASLTDLKDFFSVDLPGAPKITEFSFYKHGVPWVALMCARHWHEQLPRNLMHELFDALSASVPLQEGTKQK